MKTPFPTTPCKGCGKLIIFAKLESGGLIPLDPRPPIYWAARDMDGIVVAIRVTPHRLTDQDGNIMGYGMVSHFATCPAANQFSKKGKS